MQAGAVSLGGSTSHGLRIENYINRQISRRHGN
jgi:hypothetical protein